MAFQAAKLSTELKVTITDSTILTIARVYNAKMWAQYVNFADIEDVEYIKKNYQQAPNWFEYANAAKKYVSASS